jgi:hypothetical protein
MRKRSKHKNDIEEMEKVQTLNAPIFEVKQDSEWYKQKVKQQEDTKVFFKTIKERYGISDGFGFYHSEFFGIHYGTEDYKKFKDELRKNPHEGDFYIFKKRSKYYKEIKELLEKVEDISLFKSHDTFGTNNVSASQWVGEKWFFGVKKADYIKKHDEITPIDYKDYLKTVMNSLD